MYHVHSTPNGNRTRFSTLKVWYPRPVDDRGMSGADGDRTRYLSVDNRMPLPLRLQHQLSVVIATLLLYHLPLSLSRVRFRNPLGTSLTS